ncbi:hypothetical protein E2C01_076554 [Portunus trituberculatus]|uniref:Uncharacterized protein n=1 Tax=Portunus trituberculatus TaxID=210409 RepID=A0A5B7II24_PORTR|nr:hypothetical protein [Portunus trituberculatus]
MGRCLLVAGSAPSLGPGQGGRVDQGGDRPCGVEQGGEAGQERHDRGSSAALADREAIKCRGREDWEELPFTLHWEQGGSTGGSHHATCFTPTHLLISALLPVRYSRGRGSP